jgi:peptidyl-prolyl cis-trans isomerase A (cyclophilin A)
MRRLAIGLLALFLLTPTACDSKSKEGGEESEATAESAEEEEGSADEKEESSEPEKEESADKEESESKEGSAKAGEVDPKLLDPKAADMKAPKKFKAKFVTTKGDFTVEFHREWAPNGVDRFYGLAKIGFYEDVAFFRVIDGFMAQFGMHGNPKVNETWRNNNIKDDPVEKSNKRGYVTFAQRAEPNSRSTQLFVNYKNNAALDKQGFAPIGKVVDDGMKVVEKLHAGYGEGAPRGNGPSQGMINKKGNAYLKKNFPKLDYLKKVEIME